VIHAIPTVYKSTQFRSRLEARWAAFFDLMRWPWQYEPLDLAGYIPDFVLTFPHAPLLAEVKPALSRKELESFISQLDEKTQDWPNEKMLLGAALPFETGWNMPVIGLLAERCPVREPISSEELQRRFKEAVAQGRSCLTALESPVVGYKSWWEGAVAFRCSSCGRDSLFHEYATYACRVSGCWDGDHHLGPITGVERRWREAGNLVQWKPPHV
jgi:hypothetical protein